MHLRPRIITALSVVVRAAVICMLVTPYSASAAPTLPRRNTTPSPPGSSVAGYVGADRVSLETTMSSIASGQGFAYRSRVSLVAPAAHVRVRFRMTHPSGRLIFQRTRMFTDAEAGVTEAFFERGTADLDLRPGVFPVELEVAVERDGKTATTMLSSGLIVYDAEHPRLPVSVVARVSGQPLSDPNGRFVADPGRYTRPRDDVQALANWVLREPTAHVTLSVPPLLLEEWRHVADGYEFASPEGIEKIGSESPVSQQYASALKTLGDALITGRLELTTQGYSDPDLSALVGGKLLADVLPQYERGLSAAFASVESTTCTGTVPAGGSVPPRAVPSLMKAGVRYAIVDGDYTRSGDTTAPPSSYRTAEGLVVLVPDPAVSAITAAGESSATVAAAFERVLDDDAKGPLVVEVGLGTGGADVARVTAGLNGLLAQPWVDPVKASEAAAKPRRKVKLLNGRGTNRDPAGYWSNVRAARRWSEALVSATGESDSDAATARRDSLISESSAWEGLDGSWALANRGQWFADTARRLSLGTLNRVTLAVEPITLAGAKGDVPVTIRNGSNKRLKVRLVLDVGGGMRLSGTDTHELELEPRETFVEVPVDLSNALTGRLRVTVKAGDVVLDRTSVTLRASYLDRVVTVAGAAVLFGILLVLIIRRARAAERGADAAERC